MRSQAIQPTERTKLKRIKERGIYDRDFIYGVLDEGLICHVGFVVDGKPFVIPTAYARFGDEVILHGSVASRMMRAASEDVDICVSVTLLDGLVLSRSAFDSSMNYRSVVIFGKARQITDADEKRRALDALVEHLVPGRSADARGASDKESAATEVLALPIEEASAKMRQGPPRDPERDMHLDVWAGVVPLALVPGPPIASDDLREGIALPDYVRGYERPGGRGPDRS